MRTSLPSGVNFNRLAPRTLAASVATTFLAATSTTDTVPSRALATQISLPPGATSKPSDPRPTATMVWVHWGVGGGGAVAGPPGGGPPGGGAPGGGPPGGGPPGPATAALFSKILSVAELTLVVTMRLKSFQTANMWVRS